ncbi:hypothetical protein [Dactylosporangium sp. CA-139066]|uniref:hypothetical protein n=1 Tax=Dactylosporangium sp. CA-139066 TaxID=3239930 RepID=UPI003D8DA903
MTRRSRRLGVDGTIGHPNIGGRDTTDLLAAQHAILTPVRDALRRQHATATAFNRVLLIWRLENTDAAVRFLDALRGGGLSA